MYEDLIEEIEEAKKSKQTNLNWENEILVFFYQLEGMATLKKIYELVEKSLNLKPEHFKPSFGRPAYVHQVRGHISNLVQSGDLRWIDREMYGLTQKGVGRVKLIQEKI